MKDIPLIIVIWALSLPGAWAQDSNPEFERFVKDFCVEYRALEVPPLQLAYGDNLANIRDKKSIQSQVSTIETYQSGLKKFTRAQLSQQNQLDYELIRYLLQLDAERLSLENRWIGLESHPISNDGLAHIPMGKEWYAHFLKRWIDLEVQPEDLFDFGLGEIQRVKGEMQLIREKSKMDSLSFRSYIAEDHFMIQEVERVQKSFESFDAALSKKLPRYFPYTELIPPVQISKSVDRRLAQVPGFYRNNTFFYTKFEYPFNKRQVAWLYLHEAVPGHHYEISLRNELDLSELQGLFYLPGYSEGWAAYVEEIGKDIGAYQTIYDELGKWEWDLIRSVRVPLDVGPNYYGWDDEKAMKFWQSHIQGQDDIGKREIARMKRWPAQVITYKYGANKILDWKAHFENKEGFDLKSFHKKVLRRGPLPFSILESLVLEK